MTERDAATEPRPTGLRTDATATSGPRRERPRGSEGTARAGMLPVREPDPSFAPGRWRIPTDPPDA